MITLKYVILFLLGIGTALFVYPFFHESGHVLALLLFGEEILSIEFFPLPNVTCKMSDMTNKVELFTVGLAGELLPFIIAAVTSCKGFWDWYFRLSMRLICLISFVISLISIQFYKTGTVFQQDDIVKIISNFPQYTFICAVLLILLSTVTIRLIIKDIKELNTKKIYAKF